MTEPKAWHCPACNAYHAPHVDTCPNPAQVAIIPSVFTPDTQAMNTAASNPEYIQRVIRGQSKTVAL